MEEDLAANAEDIDLEEVVGEDTESVQGEGTLGEDVEANAEEGVVEDEGPEEFMINERIIEGGFGFLLASEDMTYGARLQGAARYSSATKKGLWKACTPTQDDQGIWHTDEISHEGASDAVLPDPPN